MAESANSGGGGLLQLEFGQAMSDFRAMFPEMDSDVIETVLRSNNGAVDATIDNLLLMSADNAKESSGNDCLPSRHLQQQQGREQLLLQLDEGHRRPDGDAPPNYGQATNLPQLSGSANEADLINLEVSNPPAASDFFSAHQKQKYLSDFAAGSSAADAFLEQPGRGGLNRGRPGGAAAEAACQPSSASGGGTQYTGCNSSSFRAAPLNHAYSHPERLAAEEEASLAEGAASLTLRNIVPTQQQLQDMYEENLKMREDVKGSSSNAAEKARYLEDERIALMLQNEEFLLELRQNSDFMTALEQEDADDGDASSPRPHNQSWCQKAPGHSSRPCDGKAQFPRSDYLPHGAGAGGATVEDDHLVGGGSSGRILGRRLDAMEEADFKEKLKNMSKTSRRKFAQLASIFSSRRKGGAKQLLGHSGGPSKDHLMINAELLINEDSEGEDDTGHRRPTEAVGGGAASKDPRFGKSSASGIEGVSRIAMDRSKASYYDSDPQLQQPQQQNSSRQFKTPTKGKYTSLQ